MVAPSKRTLATRLYARLTGIDPRKLSWGDAQQPAPALRDTLYYAYQKGFWQFIRGSFYRPRLRACGGRFFLGAQTRILFPSHLSVGRNVAIGDFVYMNCIGRDGVRLGNNVRLREFGWVQVTSHLTNLGQGLTIGDDTYVGPYCILGAGGGIALGRDVTLGAYVQILAEDHEFGDPNLPVNEQGVRRRGITLADGCWLGNGVIVLDGVRVGERCVVGAGSIVTRDLPDGAVAVGNPARVIRIRDAARTAR